MFYHGYCINRPKNKTSNINHWIYPQCLKILESTWNQYFAIFCKFEYCIHTCTISISAWIPNIKEEKRKNINVRKCLPAI
jgi:hypothetical protein